MAVWGRMFSCPAWIHTAGRQMWMHDDSCTDVLFPPVVGEKHILTYLCKPMCLPAYLPNLPFHWIFAHLFGWIAFSFTVDDGGSRAGLPTGQIPGSESGTKAGDLLWRRPLQCWQGDPTLKRAADHGV